MKTFGHQRPTRDNQGNIIGTRPSHVRALTIAQLDGSFGKDKRRRLIVSLEAGDLITIRPQGTQRRMSLTAFDIYRFMIRSEANKLYLEKARTRKAAKQARALSAKIRRKDRQITLAARAENK